MYSIKSFLKLLFCFLASIPFFVNANDLKHQIGQQTLVFYDSARNREIKAEIWYPVQSSTDLKADENPVLEVDPTIRNAEIKKGKYPLVLLSHGTGGGRLTMQWFAAGMVKEGYIVAAVDHWGNTYDNAVPEYFIRTWERPLDLSFALTSLLDHKVFMAVIDPNRIGAAGFSLGGFTVIALAGAEYNPEGFYKFANSPAGKTEAAINELPQLPELINDKELKSKLLADYRERNPNLHDKRIKAILAMAPAIGQSFTSKEEFDQIKIPVFIVGAEGDKVTPIHTNARYYHQMIPASKYYLIKGEVGHYVFLNNARNALKEQSPLIFKDHPSVNRGEIHKKVIELAREFFEVL